MNKEEEGVDFRMRDAMDGAAADSEMTEAGGSGPYSIQQPPSTTETSNSVREFISMAHRLVDQGQPSQAVQAVVMATRTQGGDAAVFEFLSRARESYRRRIQETAADQLASLFAECAIAEAQPSRPDSSAVTMAANSTNMTLETQESSILAETGRTQVVLDAFADGSSFICLRCGGLVSVHRKEAHYAYWCA